MTVSTTSNRISYNGDASSTVFSFPYKFFDTDSLKVYVGGVLQTITTDYAVGAPSDTGANVTFVSPPAIGVANIVIVRESNLLQQAALKSNGKFPAETVEDMVDKLTLVVQRLEDKFDQSLVVPDSETLSATLPDQATRAGMYLSFDVNGDPDVVNAVVDVTTVAGIADEIVTVAGIASSVTTVAANSADISAVAANAANINTVAGIDADVTTVAGIAADVSAVAAIDAEVVIAANNVADITNFADVYQGGKTANPTLRNDGSALQAGDLYFNTTAGEMRVYTSIAWVKAATAEPASFTADTFNGTGAQTAFTLSATPASVQSLIVFISGVRQTPTTDYTFLGTTLNFVAAPPLGTGNITTLVVSALAAGTPDNDSVSTDKLQDGAVTTSKIENDAVTEEKIADSAVAAFKSKSISDFDASVAANALTLTINAGVWDFRSTTLTDGTPITRTLSSPVSVVVPSGATLGTVNTVAARLAVVLIDNSGTLEAAVVNLAGGNQLDETNLVTTTTIGTGSDSNNVIYSTTGRTSVAYRVVGFIDITEATAGVWATAPTLVQGCGGQALASLSSIGYGQTPQNVIGSRAAGITYYNTTGKPIIVNIQAVVGVAVAALKITTLGIDWVGANNAGVGGVSCVTAIITPGASYVLGATLTGTVGAIGFWTELR